MGIQKVGARCCNNCVYWKCHSDRHFQGNPPRDVFVSDTIAPCTHSQSPHKNKTISQTQCCMFFKHFGGVTETFALSSGSASSSCSGGGASVADSFSSYLNAASELAALSGGGGGSREYSSEELAWYREERARKAAERRTWQYWFLLPGRYVCYPWVKWWGFIRDAWREKEWLMLVIWAFVGLLLFKAYQFALPLLYFVVASYLTCGVTDVIVLAYSAVAIYLSRKALGISKWLKPVERWVAKIKNSH